MDKPTNPPAPTTQQEPIRWLDRDNGPRYRVTSARLESPEKSGTSESLPSPPMKQPSPEAIKIAAKILARRAMKANKPKG